MSKVSPVKEYALNDIEQHPDICPRYQKWIKRIKKFDPNAKKSKVAKVRSSENGSSRYTRLFANRRSFRSRRKGHHNNPCNEPIVRRKLYGQSNTQPHKNSKDKPLRSKSIFMKIRQKGRNFGIRCKTSVELWRKWIKRGIRWDKHTTKEIDIDIVKKHDNKLKDFTKKNIVNEVIIEEDESQENEVHDTSSITSVEDRTKKFSSSTLTNQTIEQTKVYDNLNSSEQIQHLSQMQKPLTDTVKHKIKVNGFDTTGNGVNQKYPIKELQSLDLEKIEKLNSGDVKSGTDNSTKPSMQNCTNRPRGAIHRAFNKLLLLF